MDAAEGGLVGNGQPPILNVLAELKIEVQTIKFYEKSKRNPDNSDGIFCKNLFLKDRRGQFYLVIVGEDQLVDLRSLKKQLGAHRNLSFGCPDELWLCLGVTPGGVTPFGLLHDIKRHLVHVALDKSLTSHPHTMFNFHPLDDKNRTTLISYSHLWKFIQHCGHSVTIVEL